MTDGAREFLPPKLREIAEVVGVPAAIKLAEHWPGVRLFVPATMTPEHPVALAVGLTAAEELSHRYGGETITMPKADAYRRRLRDAKIVEEYSQGKSGRDLALKYGLHENHVYALIAREHAKRNLDLFAA